jgi:hypothetical protein
VREKWGAERAYYPLGGETHAAVEAWLKSKITPSKMKHCTRARENFLSETFHSLIDKYASKRIHYSKSHKARVAAARLDWSENRDRQAIEQKVRLAAGTTIRKRSANKNILSPKTYCWKSAVWSRLSIS